MHTQAIDATNQIVAQIAAESAARLYDFAAAMPKDKKYFTDGRHFSEEGNTLRAELFADYLAKSGLISGP